MFIAARISYIRFFTAAHIYDFHISTIIILWETLEMRRKYLLIPSHVRKCKTVKRDRVFNAICRKSCQQIVIELTLIYYEGINFVLLRTTCPNPFSWAKKKLFFDGKSRNYFGSNSQRIKAISINVLTTKTTFI